MITTQKQINYYALEKSKFQRFVKILT